MKAKKKLAEMHPDDIALIALSEKNAADLEASAERFEKYAHDQREEARLLRRGAQQIIKSYD